MMPERQTLDLPRTSGFAEEEISTRAQSTVSHPHRLLLIDDDIDQLQLYELILLNAGYEVRAARNIRAAKKLLLHGKIDLIVCDALLPQISGPQFIAALRRSPKFQMMPVILISADEKNFEIAALQLGADMFCPKSRAKQLLVAQVSFLLI
jgi:DNA-binding response OmpR family regulator